MYGNPALKSYPKEQQQRVLHKHPDKQLQQEQCTIKAFQMPVKPCMGSLSCVGSCITYSAVHWKLNHTSSQRRTISISIPTKKKQLICNNTRTVQLNFPWKLLIVHSFGSPLENNTTSSQRATSVTIKTEPMQTVTTQGRCNYLRT